MVIWVVAGREAVVFIDLDCAVTAGFSPEKMEVLWSVDQVNHAWYIFN